MLLTHAKWRTDSREAVDVMSQSAAANGGTADTNPVQDLGFMYSRDLTDPDGHVWFSGKIRGCLNGRGMNLDPG